LHEEVTQHLSLDRFAQTKLDEYGIKITPVKVEQAKAEPVKVELPPTLTNLTNTTRRIYTHDYLTKTAVEI
jgi:hypothetical protein